MAAHAGEHACEGWLMPQPRDFLLGFLETLSWLGVGRATEDRGQCFERKMTRLLALIL